MRVCEFLPEEYFDLGGIEMLKKQIDGGFARQHFCERVIKYLKQGDANMKMEACNSLRIYYNKELSHLNLI